MGNNSLLIDWLKLFILNSYNFTSECVVIIIKIIATITELIYKPTLQLNLKISVMSSSFTKSKGLRNS